MGAYHVVGPGAYKTIASDILGRFQRLPTSAEIASSVHATYSSVVKQDENSRNHLQQIMRKGCLWIFNRNLWTPEGVYVWQQDSPVETTELPTPEALKALLRGGGETGGVKVSPDGKLRFAPKETYHGGEHSPEELARDGFIVASFGKEGGKQLADVSSNKKYFKHNPRTWIAEIHSGTKITISALFVYVDVYGTYAYGDYDIGDWLYYNGYYYDGYENGYSLGIL